MARRRNDPHHGRPPADSHLLSRHVAHLFAHRLAAAANHRDRATCNLLVFDDIYRSARMHHYVGEFKAMQSRRLYRPIDTDRKSHVAAVKGLRPGRISKHDPRDRYDNFRRSNWNVAP